MSMSDLGRVHRSSMDPKGGVHRSSMDPKEDDLLGRVVEVGEELIHDLGPSQV